MAYTTLDNDVYALFPTNLTQGLTLVFGAHSVRMTPAGNGLTVTAGGNVTKTTTTSLADSDVAERLLYPNVFGPGTAVQYTPTLTGVKEEILLSRNVGKNSFAFLLETGGLVLTEQNGQFTLVDPTTKQKVGTLGEIIVFDSAGQIVRGNMTAQTIKDGQIYGITISVDQEFLASATYPVSIDPTMDTIHPIEEPIIDQPKVMIEDVSIYSDANAVNYTFIEWHQIGDVISTGYRGQAAFRFPVLYDPSIGTDHYLLKAEDISSFVLHLKSTGNTTTSNVLRASPYVPEWPENAYGHEQKLFGQLYYWYSYISDWDAEVINVPSNATFSIDLTGFAKTWKDMQHGIITDPNDGRPETGVLLWNFEDEGNIWLESVGYSTGIYVTMDYIRPGDVLGTVYFNSMYTRTFMGRTSDNTVAMMSGLVADIGNQIAWDLEYLGDGQYAIHPHGMPNEYLNGSGAIVSPEGELDSFCKWHRSGFMQAQFINVGSPHLYLGVTSSGGFKINTTNGLTLERRTWRLSLATSYQDADSTLHATDPIWVAPDEQVNVFDYFEFENMHYSETADFHFETSDETIALLLGSTITWKIGNEETVVTVTHLPTGLSVEVQVKVTPLKNGTYYIRNGKNSKYMQIAGDIWGNYDDEGADIKVGDYDEGDNNYQRWNITRIVDNYYSVISVESGLALSVQSSDVNLDGKVLVQEVYCGADRQLWSFERNDSGRCVIRPRSGELDVFDWCIGKRDFLSLGKKVVQTEYEENDGDYADEWIVTTHRYVTFVHHYYDGGQIDKYGVDAINTIYETHMAAREILSDIFDMEIILLSIKEYESYPDLCEHITSSESPICGDTNGDGQIDDQDNPDPDHIRTTYETSSGVVNCYCNDSETYLNMFPYTGDLRTIHILWSGYKSRFIASDGTPTYDRSFSSRSDGFILMSREDGDIITLIHEIAHQYAAPDHYCETVNGNCHSNGKCDNTGHPSEVERRPDWCIMDNDGSDDEDTSTPWTDITTRNSNEIFCELCKAEILAHLEEHH